MDKCFFKLILFTNKCTICVSIIFLGNTIFFPCVQGFYFISTLKHKVIVKTLINIIPEEH